MNTLTIKTDFNALLGNCSTDEIQSVNVEATKAKFESECRRFLGACKADVIEFEWCDSPQYAFEMTEGVDGFEVQEAIHEVWHSQKFWVFK